MSVMRVSAVGLVPGVDVDGRPEGVVADRAATRHRSGGEAKRLTGSSRIERSGWRPGWWPPAERPARPGCAPRSSARPQTGPSSATRAARAWPTVLPNMAPNGPLMGSESDRPPPRLPRGEKPAGNPATVRLGVGRLDAAAVVGHGRSGKGNQHGDRGHDGQQTFAHEIPPARSAAGHPNAGAPYARFEVRGRHLKPRAFNLKPSLCPVGPKRRPGRMPRPARRRSGPRDRRDRHPSRS